MLRNAVRVGRFDSGYFNIMKMYSPMLFALQGELIKFPEEKHDVTL